MNYFNFYIFTVISFRKCDHSPPSFIDFHYKTLQHSHESDFTVRYVMNKDCVCTRVVIKVTNERVVVVDRIKLT